jgi:hypothetical protein
MWRTARSIAAKNIAKRDSVWAAPEVQCQMTECKEVQKNNTKDSRGRAGAD